MDPRPVAAFRIALGALVFADFADRLRDYYAFYSDVAIFTPLPHPEAIFALGFIASLALTFGLKSRLSLLATWFALLAVQKTSWILSDGSDIVLRVMLFWLFFANPGACWSLDARSKRPPQKLTPPFALGLLQAQVMLIYLCAGLWKHGQMWKDGSAIYHVLQLTVFARAWVDELLLYPGLCTLLTWLTIATETLFAPLVLWPSKTTRWLAIGSALALHVGIFATMKVGTFSFIMPAALMLFIPVEFKAPVRLRFWPVLTGVFVLVAVSQVFATERINKLLDPLGLTQHWPMFAPNPTYYNLDVSAVADGSGEDVLVDGLRPSKSEIYSRWAKVQLFLDRQEPGTYAGLAKHMCWLHPEATGLTLHLHWEPTLQPNGEPLGERVDADVWHQPCR